jgi:DNA end-binding protein Ku
MQTIWKGAISFGLVSIPVRVYAATDERGVALRQVHAIDGGRIRYRRFCELDGEEVPYSDIAKGYELPDGDMVVLTEEDMEKLPLPSTKAVDVLQFVPAEEIDPIQTARSYYLKADGSGGKPYVLLRDAMESTGKVAIVKVALRSRESLATLRPYQGILLLQMMLWPEEVRDASPFLPEAGVTVRPQEVAMAESYIDTLSGDFDPSQYTDEYRTALEALVEAKAAGREIKEQPEKPATEVVDLMEALRQSVARAKEQREGAPARGEPAGAAQAGSEAGPEAEEEPKKTARGAAKGAGTKKTAARSAAAKDAAAKDTAAKDTAAKDTAAKDTAAKDTAAKKTSPKIPAARGGAKTAEAKSPAAKSPDGKSPAAKGQEAKSPATKKSTAKGTTAKKAAGGRARASA